MGRRKKESKKDNIELTPKQIMEFLSYNKGVKRFNVNKKSWYKSDKMTKSQLEINITVVIQYFTGLRMNEVVKLTYNQLKDLASSKKIRVTLSKSKTPKTRLINISPKDRTARQLKSSLAKMIKEWLQYNQPYLVVSSNMKPKEKILKKKNGKEYKTYYYPYINNFNARVNKKLKEFLSYKETQGEEILPPHIEKLTTHAFRNNFIVKLYRVTNNDLSKTKTIIQHSDIKLTDRYITKYIANDVSIPIF